ncbi:flavorubredoxin [Anaerosolibacter carboniphilus]|uniref:Flavorubredoxin n=1 Tax=Anaerosolibacter carboniphilus TaxID=1417629 RepID=A0A841L471_9FIRM|nr:flavodoxin domain-containing protein [Anaerosolibacter carboniphilus]MBB6217125.1 flavorubredoxin [Anaerosolibacter carboniphilus]
MASKIRYKVHKFLCVFKNNGEGHYFFDDGNDIITDILDAKAVLVASSTINNTMISQVAHFLEELMGLKPRNKIDASFGSYGWGKSAIANIERKLKEAGIQLVKEGLQVKYVPTAEDLKACYAYGKEMEK